MNLNNGNKFPGFPGDSWGFPGGFPGNSRAFFSKIIAICSRCALLLTLRCSLFPAWSGQDLCDSWALRAPHGCAFEKRSPVASSDPRNPSLSSTQQLNTCRIASRHISNCINIFSYIFHSLGRLVDIGGPAIVEIQGSAAWAVALQSGDAQGI